MNIDRHNYEEYFLLYVDNELTVEQKTQVDVFVMENPDLEEELVMLQQSKLIPDHAIVFDKKHLLIKEENNSPIDLNNYTEWLLSYIDNELNEDEKTAVEKFAVIHPHVNQELNLFQQTKLQSERIVFANKEVLYRKEKVAVVRMQWLRVAAAVLLLIGATLPFILNKRTNNRVAKVEPTRQEVKKEQPSSSLKNTSPSTVIVHTPKDVSKEDVEIATANLVDNRTDHKKKGQEPTKERNDQQLAYNSDGKSASEVTQHLTTDINDTKLTESKMSDAIVASSNLHKEIINNATVTNAGTTTPINTGLINPPVEPPVDPDEYASNNENKRLRGFFRKATRFIKNTTNINAANADNRVLIGGMAINLK
jgi:hypothetical protein